MIIHYYITVEESWRSSDLNNTSTLHFATKELRDDYFENILRKKYVENINLTEYSKNHWGTSDDKWSYSIYTDDDELEIIEKKTW
jgi:hypothetical protein